MGKQAEDIFPLTPLQRGMLFHSLAEPGAYVEQCCFSLDGLDPVLDAAAIAALNAFFGTQTQLEYFYENYVIGGTDAFLLTSDGFDPFGTAIFNKLALELPEPAAASLLLLVLCGLGLARRRRI